MGIEAREKPKGSDDWYVFINYKGRRKAKHVGRGRQGKRAAEAAKEKIQAKLALGDLTVLEREGRTTETLTSWSERWFRDHVTPYCQPATQQNYRIIFQEHWLPALGALPLTAVTAERVRSAVAGLLERLKPGTVRSALIPLRGCLNAAIEAGHLTTNPTRGTGKLVARRAPEQPFDPRDLFERDDLESLAGTARREMPQFSALTLTLTRTAVRPGEVFAFQVDDLDWASGYLWVRRTASRGRMLSERPKGRKVRRIEMSPQLAAALRDQESLVRAEAAVRGAEPRWLFPQPGTDERLYSGWFHGIVWRPLLRRAGLRYRRPHLIRHSVASVLLHEGVPLPYVSELLGHHSPAFTATVYAHALPNATRGIMARLDSGAIGTPKRNPAATVAEITAGLREPAVS